MRNLLSFKSFKKPESLFSLDGTVAIRKLRTKKASDDRKLKFDQLYCINELLANDVLLVSKILLDNKEALWPKTL